MVNRASELGLAALAITDRNSLAGVVRAHVAAKASNMKLIIGAEITPEDAPPVVLLATDRAAYAQLSLLITRGRRQAEKGDSRLDFDDVVQHSTGLLACVLLQPALSAGSSAAWKHDLRDYRDGFADRCYGLAELNHGPHDELLLQRMSALSERAGVPLAAANDVHYHVPERQPLQDVLTAIRHRCTVTELGELRFPNAERHLKSADEMQKLFSTIPAAVFRTREIADRCHFSLDELRYEYPEELCPQNLTPFEYLKQLTWQGAQERYPQGIPDKVVRQIHHELKLIRQMKYETYFLTVWDLVRFARSREQEILCQGRGSAANSTVCYCLKVTSVDPDHFETAFERFISESRNEPPDIDVDFEHERREEVIQYIYNKYGRDRAGMTAVVTTYRTRSAIRDVGKALGFSIDRITQLSKLSGRGGQADSYAEWMRNAGIDPDTRQARQLARLVEEIKHFPRHLSQHVGGMVFTRGKLSELVPIENATMPERTVVQWDKDDLDALGILKVDCLSLGMLTAIRKCFDSIYEFEVRHQLKPNPVKLDLVAASVEDDAVYQMIQQADTLGVFQIESRAQMSMLPRLKPKEFYDLVIEVAIVRPGPIQGDMVHPYLKRRQGIEPVSYPDDRVAGVLKRTLGVPIFQEQVMQLAMVAAGFSADEADQLRRAMGAWRRQGVIDQFYQKFIEGMVENDYELDFAERVFKQIQGFGEYGFPESHSISFALLAYVSAWLKYHHPAEFTTALLNSQPMGFYQPAQLVSDARRHGVAVRPVDVSHSDWDCTLELGADRKPEIRLGFRMIKGLSQGVAEKIVRLRKLSAFRSFDDFKLRMRLENAILSRLSRADAFASLQLSRRPALWQSLPDQQAYPLVDQQATEAEACPDSLPTMSHFSQVMADYRSTQLSLKGHPVQRFRLMLDKEGAVSAAELPEQEVDRVVRVAGIVLNRQHPGTANGITFMTLEDETGTANLVVHPNTWKRFRTIATTASLLLVRGKLQKESSVIHIIVDQMQDWSAAVAAATFPSRNFH